MKEIVDRATTEQVPVDNIYVGRRLRGVNESKMREYMKSMKATGLLHPIVVDSNRNLVVGMHRLEAAKKLGWKTISARVVEIENPHQAILMEAEENLQTSELSILELAIHVTAKDDALRAMGMRREHGGSSKKGRTVDQQAAETGIDKFLLYRLWRIGRGLSDRAKHALLGTNAANKKVLLLKIAEIEDQDRQLRIALRVAKLKAATLKEAKQIFDDEGEEIGRNIKNAIGFLSKQTAQKKASAVLRQISLVLGQAIAGLKDASPEDLARMKAAPNVVSELMALLKSEGLEIKKPTTIACIRGHETRKRHKTKKEPGSPWTPLTAIPPTKADADRNGEVLVWNASSGTVGRARWNKLKPAHSHWQKIVSPFVEADDDISE